MVIAILIKKPTPRQRAIAMAISCPFILFWLVVALWRR
jgi:hypothetical protein